jgi:tetratricopeptide (TPR) repeat protein
MVQKDNLLYGLAGIVVGIIAGVVIAGQSTVPRNFSSDQQQVVQTASAPVQQQQQQQAQQQLPEGHPPIDTDAMKKQLETNKGILEKDPENQVALVTAANLSSDLKDYPQAIGYYEKALKKDPKNTNLLTDLGTAYFYSNNANKALQIYNQSLSIDPKHFQTLMNIGIVKMSMGDHKGAAESWDKVITLYPDSPEAQQLKEMVRRVKEGKAS